MPNASLPPSAQRQADCKLVIYAPKLMREELEARVALCDDGSSISRVVRQAIREYFKRHPIASKT